MADEKVEEEEGEEEECTLDLLQGAMKVGVRAPPASGRRPITRNLPLRFSRAFSAQHLQWWCGAGVLVVWWWCGGGEVVV